MPESMIRRFRGVAYDLPESRNSGFAAAALNVYEKERGLLARREGTRRAVEYKANGPVMMIVPLFHPGGRYTGRGGEFLIQVDTEIRHIAANFSSGVAPSGGPRVTSATRINIVQGGHYDGYHRVIVKGANFDDVPGNRIVVEFSSGLQAEYVDFVSPSVLIALVEPAVSPPDVSTVDVIVTNPDGETGTLADGYSFA